MKPDINPFQVDVFALGAAFIFTLDTSSQPKKPHDCNGILKFSKDVPYSDALKDLVNGMIAVNRLNRYTIQQVVNHPWFGPGGAHGVVEHVLTHAEAVPVNENVQVDDHHVHEAVTPRPLFIHGVSSNIAAIASKLFPPNRI